MLFPVHAEAAVVHDLAKLQTRSLYSKVKITQVLRLTLTATLLKHFCSNSPSPPALRS